MLSWKRIKTFSLIDVIKSSPFKESIYVASPTLYNEVYCKHVLNKGSINAIVKYFSRSCTRCTPFGLFAGCAVAPITSDCTSFVILNELDAYKTYTRIDMDYLCHFIRSLEAEPSMREKLLYHVNSSLYHLADRYRYIEYRVETNNRKYFFSEIKKTPYLENILDLLKGKEMHISEMAKFISTSESVEVSESTAFVNSLIDNQILQSNLEPSVCGKDLIYQIESEILRSGTTSTYITDIIKKLRDCDNGKKESLIDNYVDICHLLNLNEGRTRTNYPLHVDCLFENKLGGIGQDIISTVTKGVEILMRLSRKNINIDLEKFKTHFYDLYEEEEIPLPLALDPQIGVGYAQWTSTNGDNDPILSNMPFSRYSLDNQRVELDNITHILFKKFKTALRNNSKIITLNDEDLKELAFSSDSTIPHGYALFSVTDNNKHPEILMHAYGTSTALKLISRFEYMGKEIEQMANELAKFEKELYKDAIIAEILHLPEDRIGNIQMHPNNRDYAICYFSNPQIERIKNVIPISDIMVSVPGGKEIVLRSKKHDKRVIPILSTAHNYILGLPIYRFLCDLHMQHSSDYSFYWGKLFSAESFLPRVQYNNIILSPARWLISYEDLSTPTCQNGEVTNDPLSAWREKYSIPKRFCIIEGDNKLYIDCDNSLLKNVFLEEFKRKRNLMIEEFMYSENKKPLVIRDGEPLTNEIIMFFNNLKL